MPLMHVVVLTSVVAFVVVAVKDLYLAVVVED